MLELAPSFVSLQQIEPRGSLPLQDGFILDQYTRLTPSRASIKSDKSDSPSNNFY